MESKMNRNIILIALLGLLFVSKAVAQSVTVEAKIDSLQILIGEQAKVQLQVAMDAKQRAIFPAYTDTLVRGVEIIETVKPDTQFLNARQRMLITQEYVITSFDSALYYLPPMPVTVDGKEYKSKALALKVYSIPVDTLHPDQFFGQKPVMKAPFAWEDWYGLISCSFLALPLLGLLIYLIVRIRDNKPIIRKIKVEPKLPPHQAAMKEIERIKTEKVWQKGRSKEYYTELTDALRTYIKDRFGFNALEMTSSEIIDKLLEKWKQGACVVCAVKKGSKESGLMWNVRKLYYKLVQKYSEISQIQHFTGAGLYDAKVVEWLNKLDDPVPSLRGMVAEYGCNIEEVYYVEEKRKIKILKIILDIRRYCAIIQELVA